MNRRYLDSVMILNGDTNKSLSEAIGISLSRLYQKKKGYRGAEFTQGEIKVIKERYHLNSKEIDKIFFDLKVS